MPRQRLPPPPIDLDKVQRPGHRSRQFLRRDEVPRRARTKLVRLDDDEFLLLSLVTKAMKAPDACTAIRTLVLEEAKRRGIIG